jgi:DNA-binding Lrp family transcriptional regulator
VSTLKDRRQRGWYHIDNALLDAYGPMVGANGIAVYNVLARRADKDGDSFPSYSLIAESVGISRPTAIAAVRTLIAYGLVTCETVRVAGKRPQNHYRLVTVEAGPNGKGDAPVKEIDQSTGKADEPVNEVYQSNGKADLPVKRIAPTGKAALPEMVKQFDCNNTQLTRPIEEDGGEARGRASPPTDSAAGDLIPIPPDLSPGEAERQQMESLKIPRDWYQTKWWSLLEHYEGKPDERRTEEKWRQTCRRLISEDWAKELAKRGTSSRSR